jgi:hypothetical protein
MSKKERKKEDIMRREIRDEKQRYINIVIKQVNWLISVKMQS